MRNRNVGKVRIDDLYNLEIKIVQPCDELHRRRVVSDDYELLGEEAFDDKPAAVMLQSCFTKLCLKRIFSSVVSLKLYL